MCLHSKLDICKTMDMNPTTDLVTVAQAAEMLNISGRAVRYRIERGTIPAQKLGDATSAYILNRADIEALAKAAA